MNTLLQKEILELRNLVSKKNFPVNFSNIPEQELKAFLDGIKKIKYISNNFELEEISKDELEKWSLGYLLIHDLFHKSFQNDNLYILETEITLQTFEESKKILTEKEIKSLEVGYLLLSLASLETYHSLEYLISEKIIIGESYFYGVFSISLWGYKFDNKKFEEVISNLLRKLKDGSIEKLIQRYKNLVPDFLKFNKFK